MINEIELPVPHILACGGAERIMAWRASSPWAGPTSVRPSPAGYPPTRPAPAGNASFTIISLSTGKLTPKAPYLTSAFH